MTTLSMREILVHVEQDQRQAERLQVRLRAVETSEREDALWEFVGAIARHEFVAEVVVHPSIDRRDKADGDDAVIATSAETDDALDDSRTGHHGVVQAMAAAAGASTRSRRWNAAHMYAHSLDSERAFARQ